MKRKMEEIDTEGEDREEKKEKQERVLKGWQYDQRQLTEHLSAASERLARTTDSQDFGAGGQACANMANRP